MLSAVVSPVWGSGGGGGSSDDGNGQPAWAGGTGWTGNPGASAQNAADDGGGGGGAGGGAGGAGSKGLLGGGGDGGSGGLNGNGAGTPTLSNTSQLKGTNGGTGANGDALASNTGGGGGGAGGYGAVVTGGGTSFNAGTIIGGNGGGGGESQGSGSGGGFGGDGGVGAQFTSTAGGATFTNSGTITGGSGGGGGEGRGLLGSYGGGGGKGGEGFNSIAAVATLVNTGQIWGGTGASGGPVQEFSALGTPGAPGAGGVGVTGANLTVYNAGTIGGGLSANGVRANAITFTGGTNTLVLQPGYNFIGNVVAFSSNDTLSLGGSGSSFNSSSIGTVFQGFGTYSVSSGTWTLAGSTPAGNSWTVGSGGTLSISSDSVFGPTSNGLTLAGGTLQVTQFVTSRRTLTLADGTMSTITVGAPFVFGWQAPMVGGGGLIVAGTGTFQILAGEAGTNLSTYSGPTIIQSGATLQIGGGANVLSPNSDFTVAAGGTLDLAGTTQAIGSLSGGGTVTNSMARGSLVVGGNNASTTFSGILQDGNGPLALVKNGSGTMTLTGANAYSGGTTVSGGILLGNTSSLQGAIVNNAQVVFQQGGSGRYAGNMSGTGSLAAQGSGTLYLTGSNSYTGGTTVAAGMTLRGGPGSVQGHIQNSGAVILETDASGTYGGNMGGAGTLTKLGSGILTLSGSNSYSGGTMVSAGTLQGSAASLQGDIINNAAVTFDQATSGTYAGAMSGSGSLSKIGSGTLFVSAASSYSGPTLMQAGRLQVSGGNDILSPFSDFSVASGAVLDLGGTAQAVSSLAGGGTVTNGNNRLATLTVGGTGASSQFSGSLQDGAGPLALVKAGSGTLYLSGASTYSGTTQVEEGRLHVTGGNNILSPNSAFILGRNGVLDLGGSQTVASLQGSGTVTSTRVGQGTLTVGTNSASTTFGGILRDGENGGTLALVKTGTGSLNLLGANSYSGGTSVLGGILQGNSTSLQGNILNNSLVIFHQDSSVANNTYAGSLSGNGSLFIRGGGGLSITGNSAGFTGPTTVFGTTLALNGNLGASSVTLDTGSTLSGNGVTGSLTSNASILAPGNSIGTLSVNGGFVQNGGTYQLDVNGQGQADLINVGGTAVLNGGVVQVQAAQGSYANSTTYVIASAAGGLSGTYTATTDNLAFLTPTLSYDGNNAYLTLALQGNAFSNGGKTPNQRGAGRALDRSYRNANGDFGRVIGALAGLNDAQGAGALDAISGQSWADVGTMNLAGTAMFMDAVAQQMVLARAGGAGAGQRQALAQACDIAMCDVLTPFSVWGGALVGTGSAMGDGNASGVTYMQGGAAAGIDYRVNPSLLMGLGVGYSSGSMWVNTFAGKGWNDAVTASVYASFTPMGQGAGFYADTLAGYGYANNQMQRQIVIPNLAPRMAWGSTGANQVFGQVELGYQLPVHAPAQASVTPFGRLQAINVTQNAFSEWGANALDLNVQQQATNALRSIVGAQLNGSIPLGGPGSVDLALRLGWQHEFAYTGRPMTASFAGAPSAAFTVYGAVAQRDAAVIGLQADTRLSDSARIYLRYDGALASGNDNHALTAGLRYTW